MPCNSGHLNPTALEIQASQALCVIDETRGLTPHPSWWRGYHPDAYGSGGSATRERVDHLTSTACAKVASMAPEAVRDEFSLEAQIWIRDHQKADRERIEREAYAKRTQTIIDGALAKLTDEEKKALGLED